MGYDINRFVDGNVPTEFICDICQDVLEEPLMIVSCEHIYCGDCIREWLKCQNVCPNDRKTVKESQLREPFRAFRNLLNQLKICCDFAVFGCEEFISLDQLQSHSYSCQHNQYNIKLNCICGLELAKIQLKDHQDNCLVYIKMRLKIAESQLNINTKYFLDLCHTIVRDINFECEEKTLFLALTELIPEDSLHVDLIEQNLVYLNWQLLVAMKSGSYSFKDIAIILNNIENAVYNYDNALLLIKLNGLRYLKLCKLVCNNNELINQNIVNVIDNTIRHTSLRYELMKYEYIEMLLELLDSSNLYISLLTSLIVAVIIVDGVEIWQSYLPDYDRNKVLSKMRSTIFGWKLNDDLSRSFNTLKNVFTRLKSDAIPAEVHLCYVWLLAYLTRKECDKYFPMIESENGIDVLKTLSKTSRSKYYVKQFCDVVIFQYDLYKRFGHLNGLENSNEMDPSVLKMMLYYWI